MSLGNGVGQHPRFENPVIAALETLAQRRRPGGGETAGGGDDPIDRAIAIIEAASARFEADDFTAFEAVFAGQTLALDVIFDQFARRSARGEILFHDAMRMALKAQSQCRSTMKTLMALKTPRAEISSKRTDENEKTPA